MIWAILTKEMHLDGKTIVSMVRGDKEQAKTEARLQASLLPPQQFSRKAWFRPATPQEVTLFSLSGNVIR